VTSAGTIRRISCKRLKSATMIAELTMTDATIRSQPAWLSPTDVLGSAVKHVAAISSAFNWTGIYILRGDTLELGPYIGAATEHTRI
jgi:putative methionine-R-sulfoxide reductase with GAF domain